MYLNICQRAKPYVSGLMKGDNVLERGILLLDKSEELTSMRCVEVAKRLLKTRKAGHSGTLDPKVTGLMLIAFNEATKAMPVLLGLRKDYEGLMKVHGALSEQELARAVKPFTGRITQTPPRRSAVARRPRQREVFSFEILSVDGRDVRFRTSCEAGTYVRTLCHGIGETLGTGAHMASLRRTGIGPFSIDEAVTMEQLESRGESCLFPLEDALERLDFPMVHAAEESLQKLRNGVPLELSELSSRPSAKPSGRHSVKPDGRPPDGPFGILDAQGRLAALARIEDNTVRSDRVFKM